MMTTRAGGSLWNLLELALKQTSFPRNWWRWSPQCPHFPKKKKKIYVNVDYHLISGGRSWSKDETKEEILSMELQKLEMETEIKTKMGAIIKTRLKGTIHCCFCDLWNRTAHQPIKNAPDTLTKTNTTHPHTALSFLFFCFFCSPSPFITSSISVPTCISQKNRKKKKLTNDSLEETSISSAGFKGKNPCCDWRYWREIFREREKEIGRGRFW